jgi:hypothetical protein
MRVETDCCRHCYGISHGYQWTPAEYDRETADALRAGSPAPELAGGIGYNPKLPPVDSCPECHGCGVSTVIVTDSRNLSRGAARLMASVKKAKDGTIELKTHDQQAALMALGKHSGTVVQACV